MIWLIQCFLFAADGVTYTLGVYADSLKKEFGENSTWSFIPSILVGVTLGSGPLASMLTNIYGCRIVTIMGAVCAAFGLAISAAAPNLIFLFLSIGIITGKDHVDMRSQFHGKYLET